MKVLMCVCSLWGTFFVFGQTKSSESVTRESDSLIHSFESYYSGLNSEERSFFESELRNTYFFDKKRSIQTLINEFGSDFYLKEHDEFQQEIANRLSLKLKPSDTLNLLKRIEQLGEKLEQKKGDIRNYIWDSFSIYYCLNSNSEKEVRYSFVDPSFQIYNSVWEYEYSFNDQGQRFVKDVDDIYSIIEEINDPVLKYDVFTLFLKNLYLGQNWGDLFNGSNKFLEQISKEPVYQVVYTPIFQNLEEYAPERITAPFKLLEAFSKKNKIDCIVQVLKLLVSAKLLERNSNYYIANYFGTLYQLTENDKSLSVQRDMIFDLEVEFLNMVGQVEFTENSYYQRAFNLLNNKEYDFSSISRVEYIKYNTYLADMSLNWWRWNKFNFAEYPQLQKKQVAQFLFLGLNEIKSIEITNASDVRRIGAIYLSTANYFSINKDHRSAVVYCLKSLEVIEQYPEYFSENDLKRISGELFLLFNVLGEHTLAQKLFDVTGGEEELFEISDNYVDISTLTSDQIIDQYSDLLDTYLEEGDDFFEGMPVLMNTMLPLLQFVLGYLENAYLEKEDFRNAYLTSRIIRDVASRMEYSSLVRYEKSLDGWFSYFRSKELEIESNKQKQASEAYVLATFDLRERIKSQREKLENVDLQLKARNNELEQLNHSIKNKRLELKQAKSDISYWKDTTSIVTKAKQELDLAYDQLEIKEQNERSLKNQFLFLSILSSILFLASLIAFFYARRQRKKAEDQSLISESLRLAIAQVGHIGKNSISNFRNNYLKNASDKAYIALENIEKLLQRFENSNRTSQRIRTVDQEVNMGLLLAKVDFEQELPSLDLKEDVIYQNSEVKKLKVPLYTVMNIIYNSFKHSVKEGGVKIEVNSTDHGKYHKFYFSDRATKFSTPPEKSGKHGTLYIKRMLSSFNRSKSKLNYQTKKNTTGFTVTFNLDKL